MLTESHMQDPSDLLTGSANGYVAGQIIYDAFLVRNLQTSEHLTFGLVCFHMEWGNVCCTCLRLLGRKGLNIESPDPVLVLPTIQFPLCGYSLEKCQLQDKYIWNMLSWACCTCMSMSVGDSSAWCSTGMAQELVAWAL